MFLLLGLLSFLCTAIFWVPVLIVVAIIVAIIKAAKRNNNDGCPGCRNYKPPKK